MGQKVTILRENNIEFPCKVQDADRAEGLELVQQDEAVSVPDRAAPLTAPERRQWQYTCQLEGVGEMPVFESVPWIP